MYSGDQRPLHFHRFLEIRSNVTNIERRPYKILKNIDGLRLYIVFLVFERLRELRNNWGFVEKPGNKL